MAQAGTAYIEFRGDFGRAERDLRGFALRASGAAGLSAGGRFGASFAGGLRTALSGATQQITNFAKAASTALAGIGVAGGGFGLKLAADAETAQIAFEGLLGSAEEASAFITELREFAKVTPFETAGLQTAARQLLGVGYAAEEVIPTLATIGDVAATLGVGEQEIQGVIRALGQMKGKGKITAEELQQISEQIPGFSAIQAVATGLGISVPEAFEQIGKGAVPAEEGIAAIIEGMKQFPGAAGAMGRQAQTLAGLFSTFKDTIAINVQEAFAPIADIAKFFLPGLTEAIGQGLGEIGPELQSTFAAIFSNIVPLFDTLLPIFRDLIVAVGGFASVLAPLLTQMQPALAAFGDVFLTVVYGLLSAFQPLMPVLSEVAAIVGGALLQAVQVAAPSLTTLASAFATVASTLSGTIAFALPLLAQAFATLAPHIAEVATLVSGALGQAIRAIAPSLPFLANLLGEIAVMIGQGLAQVLPVLIDVFAALAPHLGEIVNLLGSGLMAALSAILPVLPTLADTFGMLGEILAGGLATLLPGLASAFAALVPHLGPIVRALGGGVLAVLEALVPILPDVADTIGELGEALAGGLGQGLRAVAPLFPVIAGAVAQLAPILTLIANQLGPVLTPIINGLATGLVPLVDALGTGLLSAIQQIAPLMGPLARTFGDLLANAGPQLAEAFTTLFDAILQDPETMAALVDSLINLASALIPLVPLAVGLLTPFLRLQTLYTGALATAVTFIANLLATVLRPIITAIAWYVENVVVPAWRWFADVLETAFGMFMDRAQIAWGIVQPILAAIGDWVTTNLIPTLDDLGTKAGEIWDAFYESVQIAWDLIQPVLTDIKQGFTSVKTWISDRVDDIIGFFTDLPGNIEELLSGLAETILAPFRAAFNGIADVWNSTIGGFEINIPDIPGIPGRGTSINFPEMPTFHTGGVVPGVPGQEVMALLEAGETVLPAGKGGDLHIHTAATQWSSIAADAYWDMSRNGWAA